MMTVFKSSGSSLGFDFVERLARVAECVNPRRDSAVHGDLKQNLLDLVFGKAVLQRALDMQLQLMRPVEGAEHREIDDAARASIHAWPGPQRAPAKLGRP